MRIFSKTRYGIFFTVVFVYIFGSFIWWWWLLHNNNRTNFETLVQREMLVYQYNGRTLDEYYASDYYQQLNADYRRKTSMLALEGLIFVTLLVISFIRIRNTFREEIALTRQQNNFLLSITHELKSPLASLKLSMQTMERAQLEPSRIKRLTEISLDDINRLEALVENILLASKMDGSDYAISKEPINLSALCSDIFGKVADKFGKDRTFSSSIPGDIYILGDKLIFSSAIYNLLENAVKYSRSGDSIALEVIPQKAEVIIQVKDTGIGIPDSEKSKVFDMFYRVGNEDTRTTKGTGLGLYIVKQVVHFHGGTIQLKNNGASGSVFSIKLPLSS